jgi:uncharacterized cupin superfamily protein
VVVSLEETTMADDRSHLVRADEHVDDVAEWRHPLNPKSLTRQRRLSDFVGFSRVPVVHVHVPPGQESFVYHSHQHEEEWIYILSGRGIAEIGDSEFEVGPGDFMGFPVPSVGHHLRNAGSEDLVYLMGGERREMEVSDFPRHGRRVYRSRRTVDVVEVSTVTRLQS